MRHIPASPATSPTPTLTRLRSLGVFARVSLAALALLGLLALPLSTVAADSLSKDAALTATLKKQRLQAVSFKESSLKDVVKWLRIATGKNIVIKHSALTKAGIEWDQLAYNVELKDVAIWTFMETILTQPYGMGLKVKGNIVWITSKTDTYGKPVTKMYGISHITYTKTDFIAPEINLQPSGFTGDEYEPEKIVEDDPLTDGEAVAELLKEILLPKGWEDNADWSIRATNRYLVIRAPREVHARVSQALAKIASMK
jgi:hypothetical protein